MRYEYTNQALTTIANPIGTGNTTIDVVDGSKFPTAMSIYTISKAWEDTNNPNTLIEIVTGTRTGNTLTVVRWQDWTAQQTRAMGDVIAIRVVSKTIDSLYEYVDDEVEELKDDLEEQIWVVIDSVEALDEKIDTEIEELDNSLATVAKTWSYNDLSDKPWWIIKLAWESIDVCDVVRYWLPFTWDTINIAWNNNATDIWRTNTDYNKWQSFVLTNWWFLQSITVQLRRVWSSTISLSMRIFRLSDIPTSIFSSIALSTNSFVQNTLSTSFESRTFNFNNILLPPDDYVFVVNRGSISNTSNYAQMEFHGTNPYADWVLYRVTNSDWRSTPNASRDVRCDINVATLWENVEKLYKARANNVAYSHYLWFAQNSWWVDDEITIDTSFTDKLTWLTPNEDYYLSNTPWAISTTPWTIEKKVWRSISTTELLINLFN